MIRFRQVSKTDDKGMVWELSPFLAKKLKLAADRVVILRYGSLSVKANVKIAKASNSTRKRFGLSEDALEALKIPQNLYLGIKTIDHDQFRLGPVIGILTFPHVIRKNQLNRYINYAKVMKDIGLLYVFIPSDIHSETVSGFHFNEEKKAWESGNFPYPDVVIDRMYPNDYKAHSKLEKVIGPNKIFNKKTLISKKEFYETLQKDPYLKNSIPKTKVFQSASDLNDFFKKYNEVFLKPLDSMRGKGIINVTREQDQLLCKYMDGDKPITKNLPKSKSTLKIFDRLSKDNPYMIQAAVNKMNYKNRAFSFRVITTKDGSGRWCVPIVVAQSASPGFFLTNVSSGADYVLIKNISAWIMQQLPDKKINLLEELTDLSLKTSTALDNEFGPLGKLGIDVVIDVSGKLWLIEANGNPGVIFRRGQTEFPDWHHQSYEHPIAYALYLADFSKSI